MSRLNTGAACLPLYALTGDATGRLLGELYGCMILSSKDPLSCCRSLKALNEHRSCWGRREHGIRL